MEPDADCAWYRGGGVVKAKTFDRILLVLAIAISIVLVAGWRLVFAQSDHECQGGHNCNDDPVIVSTASGGDNLRSYALGSGGPGDVDISGCLGSTQWGFLTAFKQKLVRDETCVGFRFLMLEKYELAAMHFCNDKATLKEFESEKACEFAHDFTPPDTDGVAQGVNRSFDENYELTQEQEEEIEYLQEENASIVGRLDALAEYIEQAPVQPQDDAAAFRRSRAKEAYQKALEGNE